MKLASKASTYGLVAASVRLLDTKFEYAVQVEDGTLCCGAALAGTPF